MILWELRSSLGVISLINKEFKNGLKQKLQDNFIKVYKKNPRVDQREISAAAQGRLEGRKNTMMNELSWHRGKPAT